MPEVVFANGFKTLCKDLWLKQPIFRHDGNVMSANSNTPMLLLTVSRLLARHDGIFFTPIEVMLPDGTVGWLDINSVYWKSQ